MNDTPEQEILDFKETIEVYFHDQARDYLHLMENKSQHTRLLNDKLGGLEMKPESDTVGVGNYLLGQKMNALAWVIRCQQFITEIQKGDIISAYRNSEVPIQDIEKTRAHHSLSTNSLAILTVCDTIKNALANRLKNQKPFPKNEDTLVEQITWPI